MRRAAAIVALAIMAGTGAALDAQSRLSIDGSTIKLEIAPPKTTSDERGQAAKKDSAINRIFKDFRPGSCRASAAPTVPGSTWPARGDAAVTACRP